MVEQDRRRRGGADAAELEAAEADREVAGAEHERGADGEEDPGAGEIDPVSTKIRPAAAAISPNTTTDRPPITGPGITRIAAPNFGDSPNRIATSPATAKTRVE